MTKVTLRPVEPWYVNLTEAEMSRAREQSVQEIFMQPYGCESRHRHSIFCILPPHILREMARHGSAAQRNAALNTLALDATTLGTRFTVLALSVVYRGCAIPVAWTLLPATAKHAWRREWWRMLRQVHRAVPRTWTVLVLADRVFVMRPRPGRLFEEITINLARPRDRTSELFDNFKRRVLTALDRSLDRNVPDTGAKSSAGEAMWW